MTVGLSPRLGTKRTPARLANRQPTTQASRRVRAGLVPLRLSSSGLSTTARTSRPRRVNWNPTYKRTTATRPTAKMITWATAMVAPKTWRGCSGRKAGTISCPVP